MRKVLAGAVALCLILLSPGLECYARAGEVVGAQAPAARVLSLAVPASLPQALPVGPSFTGVGSPLGAPGSVLQPVSLPAPQAAASQGASPLTAAAANVPGRLSSPARLAPRSAGSSAASLPAAAAEAATRAEAGPAGAQGGAAAASDAGAERAASSPADSGRASPLFSRIHERVLAETKTWLKAPMAMAASEAGPAAPGGARHSPGLAPPSERPQVLTAPSGPPAPQARPPEGPRPGGVFARARAWLSRFYHVFPDKARNKDFWLFNLAQVIITQGATFYSTALPAFVAPTKALSSRMGMVRAASFGSALSADVVMGPSVDQRKTSSLLFKTYFGRGIFLIAIPVLAMVFFHGGGLFPTLPLVGLLMGMSFLQSGGVLAANVGFNRLLGDDPAYYNKANAANSLIVNVSGVVGPAIAGAFLAWATTRFGASSGNALAFGIYGLAAILAAFVYRRMKLVNRDGQLDGPSPKRTWSQRLDQAKEMLSEVKKGFALLWKDRFLRLTLLLSTASLLIGDAIFFLALPSYLAKLGTVALPAFIAHAPLIGHWLSGFMGSPAAIFGLFLAASSLGATVFDAIFISRHSKKAAPDPAQPKPKGVFSKIADAANGWLSRRLGADLTPLQKQGIWSSVANAVGWGVSLALFLSPHLWLALGAMAVSSFLQSPASMVWASLEQGILNKTYAKDQAKIWSAMSVYNQVFTMAGDLIFGLIMAKLATGLALGLVMGVMGVCAVLALLQPFLIFRPAPIANGPKPPDARP